MKDAARASFWDERVRVFAETKTLTREAGPSIEDPISRVEHVGRDPDAPPENCTATAVQTWVATSD